eukprot:753421-Hanusia_phi.AAC.5
MPSARFITQVTAEAHEKCKREERKAITGDDILWSINQLGFMHYTKVVRCFLQRQLPHLHPVAAHFLSGSEPSTQTTGLRGDSTRSGYGRTTVCPSAHDRCGNLIVSTEHKAKSQPPRLLVDTPLNCNSLAATNRPFMAANSKAKRVLELEDKSRDQSTCKKRHQI